MSEKADGGSAFPTADGSWRGGMTLRDWFAGQALCAMGGKSADVVMASIPSLAKATGRDEEWRKQMILGVTKSAYDIADAMIEARKK